MCPGSYPSTTSKGFLIIWSGLAYFTVAYPLPAILNLKYPIKNIFNYGRFAWSPHQFIDETGYTGQMTIKLSKKFESVAQVNRFLKDYDLEVRIEERLLDVIVINEGKK